MNQKILLEMCVTLIKSKEDGTLEVLEKEIKTNKSCITDKEGFYKIISEELVKSMYNLERSKSIARLELLKKFLTSNIEIKESFNDALIKLITYNYHGVNNYVIELSQTKGLKEYIIKLFRCNLNRFCFNEDIIDFLLNTNNFGAEEFSKLEKEIKELNSQAQSAFKKAQEGFAFNEFEREDLTNKHKKIADIMIKCIKHFGKKVTPNTEFFYNIISSNSELNKDFLELFKNLDIFNTSDLDYFLLACCLSWSENYEIIRGLIENDKLSHENLNAHRMEEPKYMVRINDMLNGTILNRLRSGEEATDKEKQFLKDVLNSQIFYYIKPNIIIDMCEYLYGNINANQYASVEMIKNSGEVNETLSNEVYELVHTLIECGGSEQKNLYEQLLMELLKSSNYSQEYERSIYEILGKIKLNLEVKDQTTDESETLLFIMCKYASDKVLEMFLELYELPIMVYGRHESLYAFNIYTKVGHYDKALTLLQSDSYELCNKGEQWDLGYYSKYNCKNACEYKNNLTETLNHLLFHGSKADYMGFLNEILKSNKLTIMNCDNLRIIKELYLRKPEGEENIKDIAEHFIKRLSENKLMMFKVDTQNDYDILWRMHNGTACRELDKFRALGNTLVRE